MPVVARRGLQRADGVEMAKGMEKAGAGALLVMPPYYINAADRRLCATTTKRSANAVSMPLSLYSRDWAVFTPDMVARLADRIPNLSFWKDGQGDTRKYQRIMAKVGDRLAWIGGIGDDCVRLTSPSACRLIRRASPTIAPKVSLAMADAGMRRDFDEARRA